MTSAVLSGLRPPAPAVEDDVGHLLAAQTLGALLAEHPLDGVDDVRFAGAVGTDDHRDAGRKLEPRLVGKALEAGEFERFEHGKESPVGSQESTGRGARVPAISPRPHPVEPTAFRCLGLVNIGRRSRFVRAAVILLQPVEENIGNQFGRIGLVGLLPAGGPIRVAVINPARSGQSVNLDACCQEALGLGFFQRPGWLPRSRPLI